jgi:hypothetical protein
MTSQFVLATGSGVNYTAIIPGQSTNTEVSYYILSTTLTYSPGNDLDDNPDMCTIRWNNNNDSNYTYTVRDNYGFFASAAYLEKSGNAEFYNCFKSGDPDDDIGMSDFTGFQGNYTKDSGNF